MKQKKELNNVAKLSTSDLVLKDIFSQNLLSPLINGHPYLPFTYASVDFHSLSILMNDILINQRKSIIEFGSGISTFLIGRLIKLNGISAKLYSVESDEDWCKLLRKNVLSEKLDDVIEVICAPLEDIDMLRSHNLPWYSTIVLDEKLKGITFDMVLVDGPNAYQVGLERSRFPAYFYMKDKLQTKFSLFIHDSNRLGEISIIEDWSKDIGALYRNYTKTLAGFTLGSKHEIWTLP